MLIGLVVWLGGGANMGDIKLAVLFSPFLTTLCVRACVCERVRERQKSTVNIQ